MMCNLRAVAAAGVLLISMSGGGTASAQKRDGALPPSSMLSGFTCASRSATETSRISLPSVGLISPTKPSGAGCSSSDW